MKGFLRKTLLLYYSAVNPNQPLDHPGGQTPSSQMSSAPSPVTNVPVSASQMQNQNLPKEDNGKLHKRIIVIAAALIVLGIGATLFLILNSKSSDNTNSSVAKSSSPKGKQPSSSAPDNSDAALSATPLRAAPSGYTQYGTGCYQVSVPSKYSIKTVEEDVSAYGNVNARCELYNDEDNQQLKISQHPSGSYLTSVSVAGCTITAQKTVDPNVQMVDEYCAGSGTNKYRRAYILTGPNTKIGNYKYSSGGEVGIQGYGNSAGDAAAIADDLYQNIGKP